MKRLLMCCAVVLSLVGLMFVAQGYHRGGFSIGFGVGDSRPYDDPHYDPYYGDPIYSGGYRPYHYRQSKGGAIASSILGAAADITDVATSRRRHYRDGYYY